MGSSTSSPEAAVEQKERERLAAEQKERERLAAEQKERERLAAQTPGVGGGRMRRRKGARKTRRKRKSIRSVRR